MNPGEFQHAHIAIPYWCITDLTTLGYSPRFLKYTSSICKE